MVQNTFLSSSIEKKSSSYFMEKKTWSSFYGEVEDLDLFCGEEEHIEFFYEEEDLETGVPPTESP